MNVEEAFDISVPSGVSEMSSLTCTGRGNFSNGTYGDLILRFQVNYVIGSVLSSNRFAKVRFLKGRGLIYILACALTF